VNGTFITEERYLPGIEGDSMGHRYAVIGAGRQGIAAAYDMVKFGDAEKVVLIDIDGKVAEEGAERINSLLGGSKAEGVQADVADPQAISSVLEDTTSFLSAVPYRFNLPLTELAIKTGTNMTDLGGHTGIVRDQLALDQRAKEAGISIVPDCGMGPGMNISLAEYSMSKMGDPKEVRIWDGGLPQEPVPPWNYSLTFNINGLTNEYFGNAYFLRDGRITEVPCFDDYEILEFPEPLGKLEAFVTSGGLSTAPWTFEGTLDVLENKTLRFPGHAAMFRSFSDLGLYGEEPVVTESGQTIVPRDVFHGLLAPRIGTEGDDATVQDFAVMLVKCLGERKVAGSESERESVEAITVLIDQFDASTGFTSMQRLTGWHASIMSILQAQGKVETGALPVEKAVSGSVIVEEARKRGFSIEEKVEVLE